MSANIMGDVLAIRVSLQGMETVRGGVRGLIGDLGAVSGALTEMKVAAGMAAAALTILGSAVFAAASDERMRLTLEGFTHSASMAEDQMRAIRSISERGLFDKQEIFESIRLFDGAKVALGDNLRLAEQLATRLGGEGHLAQAAKIIAAMAGGGVGRLGMALRNAGLTVEELRAAGLNIDQHFNVRGSPAQALEGLKKALGGDDVMGKVGGSFMAQFTGLMASLKDILVTIGGPLVAVLTPVLMVLREIAIVIAVILGSFHGLGGAIVAIGSIIWIIGALGKAFALVADSEKMAVYWGAIFKVLNSGWDAVVAVIMALRAAWAWLIVEIQFGTIWASIWDALTGNWGRLAAAAAIGIGAGVAVWAGGRAGSKAEDVGAPAERPIRRSDQERQMARGNARRYA